MRKSKIVGSFKLKGDMLAVAYGAFKDVLPAITRYKTKTSNNEVILGKWAGKK